MNVAAEIVSVWLVPLAPRVAAETIARCEALLDVSERERAGRFRDGPTRGQFVVARATLRRLLTTHDPTVTPREWRFDVGRHGKPSLFGGTSDLNFNYSHAAGLIAIAISRGGPVGIDVESIARPVDVRHFDRILSDAERAELGGLSDAAQRRRFYAIWTAKEAYAKAIGTGLREALAHVTVTANGTFLAADDAFDQSRSWRLHRIDAGEGHVAALVTAADAPPIVRWAAADFV